MWLLGELYTIKVAVEDTGGAFGLFEAMVPPGSGTPPHIHHPNDETFYVLEGEAEFMAEGDIIKATAGSSVYVPRGTLHNYTNVGTTPATFVVVVTPAGFEKMLEELGTAAPGSSAPPFGQEDIDRLLEVAPKYGLEVVPPPEQ